MTIERRPCQRVKPTVAKTFCFLVDLDKTRALILDNFVWAVATKEIPIKEWRKNWKTVELPEERVAKILDGLAAYAIYAGMTPEAGIYLPQLVPMSQAAQSVAKHKGAELLERYKTQAAIEDAAAAAGKPLTGAALMSKVKKIMGDADAHAETEAHLTATVDGSPPKGKAKKIKELVEQVSEDLAEVEAAGGDPTTVLKDPSVKKAKTPKPTAGFDVAKLRNADGEYKSVSAMFKGLILEGKHNDDQIFALVKKKFGIDESKRGYVQWNRNWLKKEGIIKA